MKKRIKIVLQILIIFLILFFFTKYILKNWHLIENFKWKFSFSFFIISIILLFLSFTFLIFLWKYITNSSGITLTYKHSFIIWFLSLFGRYLPGKIWQLAGMVWFLNKKGIEIKKSATVTLINYFINIIASAVVGSFVFIKFYPKRAWIIYITVLIILTILLFPSLIEKFLNSILYILKKQPIKITLNFKNMIFLLTGHILSWIFLGIGLYIFLSSFIEIEIKELGYIISSFSASYFVGVVVFFLPAGIGAREGMLVLFLSKIMPAEIAVPISFLQRLWMTVPEIIGGTIALILLKRSKNSLN